MHPIRSVLAGLTALAAVSGPAPIAAQIYRCAEGSAVVFSDVPCSESAEVHRSDNPISIVEAAGDLDEIAAANRAFAEERRSRLAAARRRTEASRAPARPAPSEAAPWRTVISPYPVPRPWREHAAPRDPRTERMRDTEPARPDRRTLLSRSGGTGPILRSDDG